MICLYRPSNGKKLSAIIAGCTAVTVHEYARVDELSRVLDRALKTQS